MKLEHFIPTWRWIVVEPIIEEKTKGGIYIPESARQVMEQPTFSAKVLKVAPDAEIAKEGDIAFFEDVTYAKQLDFEGYKQGTIFCIKEQLIIGLLRPENDSV